MFAISGLGFVLAARLEAAQLHILYHDDNSVKLSLTEPAASTLTLALSRAGILSGRP